MRNAKDSREEGRKCVTRNVSFNSYYLPFVTNAVFLTLPTRYAHFLAFRPRLQLASYTCFFIAYSSPRTIIQTRFE